jgi:hypothetical protein
MSRTFALIAALGVALSGSALAADYKFDAKGKCHDEHGKFAKQELCVSHTYKIDAKGKCRDERGRFAEGKFCRA